MTYSEIKTQLETRYLFDSKIALKAVKDEKTKEVKWLTGWCDASRTRLVIPMDLFRERDELDTITTKVSKCVGRDSGLEYTKVMLITVEADYIG